MPRYKRTAEVAELDLPVTPPIAPEHVETLQKLRNMWEFASLMQYIFLFGHIVKIDDNFDIEDLEAECLKSEPSPKLAAIGLALLKYVSSHRGLTPDIFEEYTRRQYETKAPTRNPFGDEDDPIRFQFLDVHTRIRILQQLSTWTLGNAGRIREMMPSEEDHLTWRMEPLGWDRDDTAYYVLDDNRLYRRSDEPVPPPTPKPKAKSKSKKSIRSKATRSSKRRKIEETEDEEPAEEIDGDAEAGAQDDTVMTNGDDLQPPLTEQDQGYGFTDKTWSLVAITLEEYDEFLSGIFRSRDPNEKQLHKRISADVRPIIEKREEALRQKQLRKLRELHNVEKLATAKRSSRLADKADKEKEERDKREAVERRQRELDMAHEEEERQKRIEDGHESRRMTREQRVKEREVKRILHEEELKRLEEAEDRAASASQEPEAAEAERKRASARQAQTQKEQHQKELEQLEAEESGDGKWYFDCSVCGLNGENMDDGSHSVACDRCGVWQHSGCHGFTPKQAEKDGFTFICKSCKRQEAEKNKPKIPPLKLGKKSSASPAGPEKVMRRESNGASKASVVNGMAENKDSGLPAHMQRQLDGVYVPRQGPSPGPFGQLTNGPSLSPHGQAQGPPGYRYPPVGNFAPQAQAPPQQPWQGSPFPPPPARPTSSGYAGSPSPQQHIQNGYAPSPHVQQHQYAHQQAVQSVGAHPGYAPPPQYQQQQQQSNGYGPHAPAGHYPQPGYPPMQHQQQGQQYYQPQAGFNQHQQPRPNPAPYPPQQQRPVSTHHAPPPPPPHQQHHNGPPPQALMNGFQSPVKTTSQPSHSPQQPSAAHYAQQPPQSSPALQRSPRTALPPPQHTQHQQHAGHSPMKSSPPPQPPAQIHQRPPPHLAATPQQQQAFSPRPPSSNGIAVDGMSGPWPAGSKAIPQKHDLPPSSSPITGEARVVPPPGAALAPSPLAPQFGGHDMQAGGQRVIPVKKPVGEVNGAALNVGGQTPGQPQSQPPIASQAPGQ